MRLLLTTLIFFLIVTDAFSLDMSILPGLSVKNGILYVIVMFLVFRLALDRNFKVEMGRMHIAFVLLVGYAILSWLAAEFLVQYPRYDLIERAIRLKSGPVDQFIFFLAFFYGVRTPSDAMAVLKSMLLAVVLANLITVVDALGILDLGANQQRDDGRAQGAIGESNQYGAFVSLFIPALFAAAAVHRGFWRLVWTGGALISIIALLMTVSRGALVGLLVGGIWSAYLFRRYLSPSRLMGWILAVALLGGLAVAVLSLPYGAVLQERFLSQSGSIDMSVVSSGRTEIWATALERMWQTPLSLLTGFGWDVYWTFPFRYSPHNHYLALWFNLGLTGLICGVFLLAQAVIAAKSAADRSQPPLRTYLIAFAIGALSLSVAVFFVDLYQPWWYFWGYAGLMMRIAVGVRAEAAESDAVSVRSPTPMRDIYGWVSPLAFENKR